MSARHHRAFEAGSSEQFYRDCGPKQRPGPPCVHVTEQASIAFAQEMVGVGGGPDAGDLDFTGVSVPLSPTTDQTNRYLIRLAGFEVPGGYAAYVLGIRQGIELVGLGEGGTFAFRQVEDPFWKFTDGNIAWGLRQQPNQFSQKIIDPNQFPGTDPSLRNFSPALLYTPPLIPYVAPRSGKFPGVGIGPYGRFNDIRFPWEHNHWAMRELVVGPSSVVLYASVRQTDPLTRPGVAPAPPGGEDPRLIEDQFISAYPLSFYNRVMGAIIFEQFPCCDLGLRPPERK